MLSLTPKTQGGLWRSNDHLMVIQPPRSQNSCAWSSHTTQKFPRALPRQPPNQCNIVHNGVTADHRFPTSLFRQLPNMNGWPIVKNTVASMFRETCLTMVVDSDTPTVLTKPQPFQVDPPLPLKLAQRSPHRKPIMQPRSNIANTRRSTVRHGNNRAPQTSEVGVNGHALIARVLMCEGALF